MHAAAIVVFVASGIVMTALTVVLVVKSGRESREAMDRITEAWRTWATARGFAFEGRWGAMKLEGVVHGLEARFVSRRVSDASEDGSRVLHEVIVTSPIELGDLSVRRPRLVAAWDRMVRGAAAPTGDAEFDAAFTVRTTDADRAPALLTDAARAALLQARETFPAAEVSIELGAVRCAFYDMPDMARTEQMFDVLGRTARMLGT